MCTMRANLSSVKFIICWFRQRVLIPCCCGATSLTVREDDVFVVAQKKGLLWKMNIPIFRSFLSGSSWFNSFIHSFHGGLKVNLQRLGLARVLGHSWQWTSCLHITEHCVLMRIQIFSKLLWKLISTKNDWEWTAACTKLFRNVKHCSRSPAFMEEHYVL